MVAVGWRGEVNGYLVVRRIYVGSSVMVVPGTDMGCANAIPPNGKPLDLATIKRVGICSFGLQAPRPSPASEAVWWSKDSACQSQANGCFNTWQHNTQHSDRFVMWGEGEVVLW